ncbi:LysE family translocator [Halobacteriales archaeon SW_10_66_29]|nr:MAG: LysE family translocator [Halobacteriales archaeon SW_10_66_29]
MIDLVVLLAFVPAVAAIVVSPGPDSIYTLTQSLSGGRATGLAASLGTATGVLVHTAAAVLGLSAILRTTASAYLLVKYLGAAYLVYLGVQLLRSEEQFDLGTDAGTAEQSLAGSYRKAVAINVSNPQVAVFVLAFFPQFVPPSANAPLQLSLLGVVYAGLSLLYLAGVALFASRARQFLLDSARTQRLVRYASGSVLIGFGAKLALEGRPT